MKKILKITAVILLCIFFSFPLFFYIPFTLPHAIKGSLRQFAFNFSADFEQAVKHTPQCKQFIRKYKKWSKIPSREAHYELYKIIDDAQWECFSRTNLCKNKLLDLYLIEKELKSRIQLNKYSAHEIKRGDALFDWVMKNDYLKSSKYFKYLKDNESIGLYDLEFILRQSALDSCTVNFTNSVIQLVEVYKGIYWEMPKYFITERLRSLVKILVSD